MRTRGAAIQGGLAAMGLLLAYSTWQREPERSPGEAMVLDAKRSDLEKVRYADDKKWIEMTMQKGPDGPEVWMHTSATDTPKAPEREVRGNESSLKLWEKLAPLRATRALGSLDQAKLKELGLDAPKKHLELTVRGQKHSFAAGQPAFYVSEPYVLDESDKKVYVLGNGVLSDLDNAASRFIDRTMHGFKANELDGVTVSSGGKKRELVQVGEPSPTQITIKLAPKKSPDKLDEQARNWHDKLWRLFPIDILGKGEMPAAGKPDLKLRVDYSYRGKALGFIEIGRVTPPPPAQNASSAPPPAPEVYARTEHTAGWVKLSPSADDVLKEADKIAAGE